MGRPRPCDCRCLDVPPDCFGCPPAAEIPETILFGALGFDWLVPEEHHGTETCTTSQGLILKETFTDHNTYSRPLSGIDDAAVLWLNPSGICQWLWSDVRTVKTVWTPQGGPTLSVLDEIDIYEPLNPADPSNPWNRAWTPIVDSRCAIFRTYRCTQADYGVYVTLIPRRIVVSDAINGYFTFATTPETGTWYWVLQVVGTIGRSSHSTGIGATTGPPVNGNGALLYDTNAVGYAHATPFNTTDLSFTDSSTPPYRYQYFNTRMFPTAAYPVYYIKEIDCDNDFNGSTVTLTYAKQSASHHTGVTLWGLTYPSTVFFEWPAS